MVVGYSLAFTDGGGMQNYLGGMSQFMLKGMTLDSTNALAATIPESVFMTFQMTFAIITPALIVGAFADRMKFSALVLFMIAVAARRLCADRALGMGRRLPRRRGRARLRRRHGRAYQRRHRRASSPPSISASAPATAPENMAPHNLVYSLIGASLLWVGWFGFNAGSAVAANGRAGMAMAVTQIATATAALAWMFAEWLVHKKPSVLGIISGAVAGLVAITPASGFVGPMGALWIGAAAGVGCFFASTTVKRALGYDDSLDVFGVHGVGGIIGAILTGVFAVEAIGGAKGALEGNVGQIWTQIEGIAATLVWSGLATFVILIVVNILTGVRVSQAVEVEGLDINLHGEVVP